MATRAAGRADFLAVFEWEVAPELQPRCVPEPDGAVRYDLSEEPSPCGTRLEVRGSVAAVSGLGGALERIMRRSAEEAAVSGAVLEMRVLREATPRPFPPDLVQALARDLWRAGFPVRFGPCWEPVGDAGLAVGAGDGEERLHEFLGEHPFWGTRPVRRPASG